ncbi:adenosine deaminase [Caerostris extrusa]|uniref:adenosine deaminase n=1 Tax=Caerostris extrusa TaxID=172846 RepID=A0AAV4SE43_CAEEX|nr:adenosine deaminase [Caerostris extrusa]
MQEETERNNRVYFKTSFEGRARRQDKLRFKEKNSRSEPFCLLSRVRLGGCHINKSLNTICYCPSCKTEKKIPLNVKTLEDLLDACCIHTPSCLTDFLEPFSIFLPVIVGDEVAIERVAYEFCEDAAKEGVLYSEVRYCPHLLSSTFSPVKTCSGPLTPREVVMSVNRGLSRGSVDFKITVRSILCWSSDILQLCLEFQRYGVVGIDVAGDESTGLAAPEIVATFRNAVEYGVHRTAHAGEAGPAKNVQIAMTDMMAQRIGHGYHVVDDPDIYAECLRRRIHFEACPYSSILTGSVPLTDIKHPIVRFAEDNANFSISRDDPTLIQKTLDQEYDFFFSLQIRSERHLSLCLTSKLQCRTLFFPAAR